MTKTFFGALALLMLAGCQLTTHTMKDSVEMDRIGFLAEASRSKESCLNYDFSHLSGKSIDDLDPNDLLEEFPVDQVRVDHPGQAVTMDYRTDRLSISVDESGIVSRATCG